MGESFRTLESLEPPLVLADERVIFIPKGRELEVENSHFKFIALLEGTAHLAIDGRSLGRIGRGDLLVVPNRCRQVYTPTAPAELRLHVMRLYFDTDDTAPKELRKSSRTSASPADSTPAPRLGHLLAEVFREPAVFGALSIPRVQNWLREIQHENEARQLGYGLRIGALCRLIAVELARILKHDKLSRNSAGFERESVREARPGKPTNWATEHVKQYMFENYHRSLTLDMIAWEVRMSNEHLCRRFKQDTGETVFEHLRRLRIDAAKAYLISSKMSVTEIAERVGFSSTTLFCRTFRQISGVTPAAFRRQNVTRISFETTSLRP